MITGPESFFPDDSRVAMLPPGGPYRMGTVAYTARERLTDSALFPASRFSAKLRRAAYSGLLTVGATTVVQGSATTEALELVARVLASVEGSDSFVVLMGTPGAGAKATLVLKSHFGSPVGFAKVAWTPTARSLVQNEATLLPVVGDVLAPRLLSHIETESMSCVVVSPLEGATVGLASRVPQELLARATGNAVRYPIADHPFIRTLMVADSTMTTRAISSLAGRDYPVSATHGDAAPWNAVKGPDGVHRMFDWEYGRREGLQLADVAHWSLQVGHLSLRMNPRRALHRAIREVTRGTDMSSSEVAGICSLTAMELANRLESEHDTSQAGWWHECAVRAVLCAEGGEL